MMHNAATALVGKMPQRYQNTAKQFIKFAITGSIGAVVDFTSYNILTRGIGWDDIYFVFGYEIIAANLVSVFLAILSNFIFNKYWTFRDPNKAIVKQWAGYFTLNVITFLLNQIFTSFFAFRVPLTEAVFGTQKDNAAKAIAIGFILFLNFLGSKFMIFRRSPRVPQYQKAPHVN